MRHGKKVHKLGRTASHRKALMMNLSNALIEHKRIETTLAKAKALRVYVEPLITKSKNDTVHNRRIVFSKLKSKESIKTLFGEIGDKVADRPGGYTRIIKLQARKSDGAEMAMIELVDYNELYTKEEKTRRTRRSRRGGGKSKAEVETQVEEVVEETVETVEEVVEETTDVVEEGTEEATDTPEAAEEDTNTEENTEKE